MVYEGSPLSRRLLGVSRRTLLRATALTAAASTTGIADLLGRAPAQADVSLQYSWQWCNKCQALTFASGSSAGACAAGGQHTHTGSGWYVLYLYGPSFAGAQRGWLWCNKCQALCYNSPQSPGPCPAGGTHNHSGSGEYTLVTHPEAATPTPGTQVNWRWCNKCQALAFAGGATLGACPAGGTHAHTGSGNYGVQTYAVNASLLASPGIQLSSQANPVNHSESDIAVNPANPEQMVAVSKRFPNPSAYAYQADAYATLDGGSTWQEVHFPAYYPTGATAPANLSDPVVAWDYGTADQPYGVCYAAFNIVPAGQTRGICILVYRSADAGRTWQSDTVIPVPTDGLEHDYDKQAIAIGPTGPVLAWIDDSTNGQLVRYARRVSGTWYGEYFNPPGGELGGYRGTIVDGFSPAIAVSGLGLVFVVWLAGTDINVLTSYDNGESFDGTVRTAAAETQPIHDGTLTGTQLRTEPIVTATAIGARGIAVTWADLREGSSRVYYALTREGEIWINGPDGSGLPLIPAGSASPGEHHFMPRLASNTLDTLLGCAYYVYRPPATTGTTALLAPALRVGPSHGSDYTNTDPIDFSAQTMASDRWIDPGVGAQSLQPIDDGQFYGDYFGLAATSDAFFPAWTDTRTGHQEIFTARAPWTGP